jgi:hypothetical protein
VRTDNSDDTGNVPGNWLNLRTSTMGCHLVCGSSPIHYCRENTALPVADIETGAYWDRGNKESDEMAQISVLSLC